LAGKLMGSSSRTSSRRVPAAYIRSRTTRESSWVCVRAFVASSDAIWVADSARSPMPQSARVSRTQDLAGAMACGSRGIVSTRECNPGGALSGSGRLELPGSPFPRPVISASCDDHCWRPTGNRDALTALSMATVCTLATPITPYDPGMPAINDCMYRSCKPVKCVPMADHSCATPITDSGTRPLRSSSAIPRAAPDRLRLELAEMTRLAQSRRLS
jgi:hypothetical protein